MANLNDAYLCLKQFGAAASTAAAAGTGIKQICLMSQFIATLFSATFCPAYGNPPEQHYPFHLPF